MELRRGLNAGLWTLTERLGRGGMAEVWRGVAVDSADVAIKLMPNARTEARVFEAEAAALARLVHPRIIRIVDFGTMQVDSDTIPFLALELAHGPPLDRWLAKTPVSWHAVLDISRRVLEALAHAHSRGLVHRDIKPANILAMDAAGVDWRLTDFGIAQANISAGDEHNPSGTPPYMAPEQFLGRSRDQGPWTDLYSLGCVMFEMLTGLPPFSAEGVVAFAFKHMREAAPELKARFDVPDGLAELLQVLLRKDPLARFRSAADVLRALEKLPSIRRSRPTLALGAGPSADTYVTPAFEPTLILGDLEGFEWHAESDEEPPVVEIPQPPVEPPATSPRHYFSTFHGDTGPGLIGLRELPFVGRLKERTAIWNAFRQVCSEKELRLLVVRGPEGIGKTALGRWLTQTVTEHGLAAPFRVGGEHDAEEALVNALIETYRLDPREGIGVMVRLSRWARPPHWAVEGLSRGVCGASTPGEDVIGAVLAMLWADAERRPLVLWVDDADDPGRQALIKRIVSLPFKSVPVLVVAAVRDTHPETARLADREVVVGPFAPGECAELVTEIVGIAADDAIAIAGAVEGNPQLAVQVVRDWIAGGLLVRSAGRWTFRGGRLPALPSSVGAVRYQKFEALVAEQPDDRAALELLACYGAECPHVVWARACGNVGLRPTPGLIVRAMRAGLIEQREGNARFADGILRRRLVAISKEQGRSPQFHHAIADIVREDPSQYPPALIGTHLFEAGEFAAAIAPLHSAIQAQNSNDRIELEALLDRYDLAVEQVGASDAELGFRGRLARAQLLRAQRRMKDAAPAMFAVAERARAEGWLELEVEASTLYIDLVSARSPTLSDGDMAGRTVELADKLGSPIFCMQARNAAGALFGYLGQVDDALRMYREASEIALANESTSELADAEYGLGWVFFLQGRLAEALPPLHRAIDHMEQVGRIRGAYAVRSFTGDVFRALGRLDEAEQAFTEAYHYFSRYHVVEGVLAANFAMLAVARGKLEDALRWARRAVEIEGPTGRRPVIAIGAATELLYASQTGDTDSWDAAFGELQSIIGDDANFDVAYVADLAARGAAGALDASRAEACLALAMQLWMRLGRNAEVEALRELL